MNQTHQTHRRNKKQIMKVTNDITINVRAVGIGMTLAALVIALLAVALTASPTMAQTPPYPDPKPCGPNQHAVPDPADATITGGHYAVFDGYWDFDKKNLNLNLCPPAVEHTLVPDDFGGDPVEVSTRTESNVDIQQTVIHINGSDFEHTLTAADVEKYDFFKVGDGDDAGTEDDAVGTTVWWLKVDDPSTTDVDEDSALAMGYSAALFETQYWYLDDGTRSTEGLEPLQYEFEVIREPGIPVAEQGHVFAFDDSPAPTEGDGAGIKTADWDSSEVDANALRLFPGNYHHYQWAFTKPGTYVISVQLKGHVRTKDDPRPAGAAADWEPISDNTVETSEVGRYVFQIGALTLNEDPAFVVERSVEEHSANETLVGDPIPVYQGDDDDLTFALSGPGHSVFSAEADANGNAQIKVADSAHLDHEARPEYRLTLSVRDNKDHESNTDASVDSLISVKINVTDMEERTVAENSVGGALVGDAIAVANADASTVYTLSGHGHGLFAVERDSSNDAQIKVASGVVINYEDAPSYILTLSADTAGTEDVRVAITVTDDPNEQLALTLTANPSDATLTVGTQVVFTGVATGSPVATSELHYAWGAQDQGGGHGTSRSIGSSTSFTVTGDRVATRVYDMRVGYHDTSVESNQIVITWQAQ